MRWWWRLSRKELVAQSGPPNPGDAENGTDHAGLLAFLCEYVTRRPASGAILIHGDWGSGKSTYVRQHVMAAINAKVVNGKPLKALYLSVAGATTNDDLDTALLRAVYPVMASALGEISSIALKAGLRWLRLELKDIKPDADLDAQSLVICIDDLERFCGTPQVLLGFIQRLVEEEGIPAILVGDEAKLVLRDERRNKDELAYREIREKVVAASFRFQPNIESAFDDISCSIADHQVRETVRGCRATLIAAIRASDTTNLRSVRVLVDLCRPVAEELKGAGADSVLTEKVLGMVAAATIATRQSHELKKEVVNFIRNRAEWFDFVFLPSVDFHPLKDFVDRNAALKPVDWPVLSSLAEYIDTGMLDRIAFRRELKALSVDDGHSPLPRVLLGDVRKLLQEEFDAMGQKYFEHLRGGTSLELRTVAEGSSAFVLFALVGLVDQSPDAVVQLHFEAMRKHHRNNTLRMHGYNPSELEASLSRLRVSGAKGTRLASRINMHYKLLCYQRDAENRRELMELLASDFASFIEKSMDETNGWKRKPLFVDELDAERLVPVIAGLASDQMAALGDFLRWRRVGAEKGELAMEKRALLAIRSQLPVKPTAHGGQREIRDYALECLRDEFF